MLQDWGTLDALIKWLYLPDFFTVPNSGNLMGQSHLSISVLCNRQPSESYLLVSSMEAFDASSLQ